MMYHYYQDIYLNVLLLYTAAETELFIRRKCSLSIAFIYNVFLFICIVLVYNWKLYYKGINYIIL